MSSDGNCTGEELEGKIEFFVRMIVLIIGLLSSLFVGLTCLFSSRYRFWTFKLLILQSICECVDIIGAISLSKESQAHELACSRVAYIMHCAWLSSFSCLILMFFLYKLIVHVDPAYSWHVQRINLYMTLIVLWPYAWLYVPKKLKILGPTGWHLNNGCEFNVYCGFTNDSFWGFFVFWTLPMTAFFSTIIYLSCKIKSTVKATLAIDSQVSDQIDFISKVTRITFIYLVAWGFNLSMKYIFMKLDKLQNEALHYIFIVIFIGFELHLAVVAIIFYKCYNPIINIKRIWKCKNHEESPQLVAVLQNDLVSSTE